MTHSISSYPYQISVARNVAGLSASLAVVAVFTWIAWTNQEPLHLFESIRFSVARAGLLYTLIAFLAAVTVVYFLLRLRRSMQGPLELMLDTTSLRTPKASLRSEMLNIPYEAISKVMIHAVSNQQLLSIESSTGRSRLSSLGFASDEAFESFYKELVSRVGRP